jgi:hypothetical protein
VRKESGARPANEIVINLNEPYHRTKRKKNTMQIAGPTTILAETSAESVVGTCLYRPRIAYQNGGTQWK